MARPSKFSLKIADTICFRIAGGESLRTICLDRAMPSRRTVLNWLSDGSREDFCAKYARAREAQADFYAEEIIEIADTPEIGVKTVTKESGTETTEGDMIEHRRLRVAARQWYAERVAPKRWGTKVQNELSGPDGGPLQIERVRLNMVPVPELPE